MRFAFFSFIALTAVFLVDFSHAGFMALSGESEMTSTK